MDKKLKIGDRVEIVKSFGVCQFEKIEEGEKGTVTGVNDHGDPL